MVDSEDRARSLLHNSVSQAASIRLQAEILSLRHSEIDPELLAGLVSIQAIADDLNGALMELMAVTEVERS